MSEFKPLVDMHCVSAFTAAMREAGLRPKTVTADGRIHRCGTEDKPHGQDGAYLLNPSGHGGFQNWQTGEAWQHFGMEGMSPEDLAAFNAVVAEHVREGAAERMQRQIDAARNAASAWNSAPPAPADHPYLVKKKIQSHGARLRADGHLLLPLFDMDTGDIKSLHSIAPDGEKRFLTGGEKKGNCSFIGERIGDTSNTVIVCEGFATGASIHEATGLPVIIAYDCGNLLSVATKVRKHSPKTRIVLAADNDHETDGNPGVAKATEAAIAVNGALAVPWPSGNAPAGQTDFNDMLIAEGVAAVQEAFKEAACVNGEDRIDAALKALPYDAGAIYQPDVLSLLRAVRITDLARWARIRDDVKASRRVKMDDFDKATDPAKEPVSEVVIFEEDDPWPDEVNGGELLDEIAATIRRFVVADDESIQAAALWTLTTYFVGEAKYFPILNITAPAKRCGKTTLLEVISHLVLRAMKTSNIATAALFRAMEKWRPTLLIDEVDAFLSQNEEARGILNAGVQPGGMVIRCVGDNHEPTNFDVSGFKALSGIGALADTLHDRSIPVRLRRKFEKERTENVRHARPEEFAILRRKAVRFAKDNAASFAAIRPAQIEAMHDRANDCWEPLLQLAELAGFDWMMKATTAAISLMSVEGEAEATDIELLAAVRRAFAANGVGKISLVALVETLIREEDGNWATYNKGDKPIAGRQVSKRLRPFVGGTQPQRQHDGTIYKALGKPAKEVAKGYDLSKFKDTFDRYLPPVTEDEAKEWAKVADNYKEAEGFPKLPI